MFGGGRFGSGDANRETLGDLWVLSLPAFRWFKADVEVFPRANHACALAGDRQMISVGGLSFAHSRGYSEDYRDPWPNGIGVLDISSLQWQSHYTHDLSGYSTPEVVQAWYNTRYARNTFGICLLEPY
jgi:hypothetical protein